MKDIRIKRSIIQLEFVGNSWFTRPEICCLTAENEENGVRELIELQWRASTDELRLLQIIKVGASLRERKRERKSDVFNSGIVVSKEKKNIHI